MPLSTEWTLEGDLYTRGHAGKDTQRCQITITIAKKATTVARCSSNLLETKLLMFDTICSLFTASFLHRVLPWFG